MSTGPGSGSQSCGQNPVLKAYRPPAAPRVCPENHVNSLPGPCSGNLATELGADEHLGATRGPWSPLTLSPPAMLENRNLPSPPCPALTSLHLALDWALGQVGWTQLPPPVTWTLPFHIH